MRRRATSSAAVLAHGVEQSLPSTTDRRSGRGISRIKRGAEGGAKLGAAIEPAEDGKGEFIVEMVALADDAAVAEELLGAALQGTGEQFVGKQGAGHGQGRFPDFFEQRIAVAQRIGRLRAHTAGAAGESDDTGFGKRADEGGHAGAVPAVFAQAAGLEEAVFEAGGDAGDSVSTKVVLWPRLVLVCYVLHS